MEVRYQKLAKLGVRNLADYNSKLERVNAEVGRGYRARKVDALHRDCRR